jgi:putative ABC transport system substrate-binding protein
VSDNFIGIGASASLKVVSLNEFVKQFPTSRDQLATYQIGWDQSAGRSASGLGRDPKPNLIGERGWSPASSRSEGSALLVAVLRVNSELNFDFAFRPLERERVDALLVTTDPVFESQRARVISLAAHHALPTIYALREYAVAGGLMTYGASINDVYRQAGLYAGRILKGEKPADLPIMRASKYELVLNLRTARTLGLQIPATLLAIADEVIE